MKNNNKATISKTLKNYKIALEKIKGGEIIGSGIVSEDK